MSFALPPTVHFSLLTPPRPAAADSCRDDVHTVSTVGHTVSTGVYCADNPVGLVDVDGRTVVPNDEDALQHMDLQHIMFQQVKLTLMSEMGQL